MVQDYETLLDRCSSTGSSPLSEEDWIKHQMNALNPGEYEGNDESVVEQLWSQGYRHRCTEVNVD